MRFSTILPKSARPLPNLTINEATRNGTRGVNHVVVELFGIRKLLLTPISLRQFSSESKKVIHNIDKEVEKEIIGIIESKIKFPQTSYSFDHTTIKGIPGSKFVLQDSNDDESKFVLRGHLGHEWIEIEVDKQQFDNGNESITMHAMVSKNGCVSLNFELLALADSIEITSFSTTNTSISDNGVVLAQGPADFSIFDEEMRAALIKYLEVRGVNTNMIDGLRNIATKEVNQVDYGWLKDLKDYMEM